MSVSQSQEKIMLLASGPSITLSSSPSPIRASGCLCDRQGCLFTHSFPPCYSECTYMVTPVICVAWNDIRRRHLRFSFFFLLLGLKPGGDSCCELYMGTDQSTILFCHFLFALFSGENKVTFELQGEDLKWSRWPVSTFYYRGNIRSWIDSLLNAPRYPVFIEKNSTRLLINV